MKLAIMQPYFFPYIGYFQLMQAVDKFVIYDDVNFIKKGWINRNRILVNQKPYLFTIPLKNASQNTLIKDLKLAVTKKWKKKFLKTLEFAYKKAPFFYKIFPIVNDVLNLKTSFLRDWNVEAFRCVVNYLKINVRLIESSSKYHNHKLKAQKRILDICVKENVREYLNPIGGIDLYCDQYFSSNGVNLSFLQSKNIKYKQFGDLFNSSLSIIDVMMFNPISGIKSMLGAYDLIKLD